MKITIPQNSATLLISKNYDELSVIVESYLRKDDNVIIDLGIFNKTEYWADENTATRGHIIEISNRIVLSDIENINLISVSKKTVEYLEDKLSVKDIILTQSYDWEHPDRTIRVSIPDAIVLSSYSQLIQVIKDAGSPVYSENGITIIYLTHIEPAHLELLNSDFNVLIENL